MLSKIRRHDDAEPRWARRRTVEATMVKVRWWGTAAALFQVLTFFRPIGLGVQAQALALVAVLALGNATTWFFHRRFDRPVATNRLSIAALAFDCLVLLGFVTLYRAPALHSCAPMRALAKQVSVEPRRWGG